ncbi:GNAT superfamily N-acetyltransferase [Streptosporangium album]|uniref:GNAT superfamily N-acetyltransferase n=1 Tax=Streptosporangium album TaxID=47479 RepID=A0A7W7S418_9ACTN|nr:GNAT family N-acetyltransferase [Streptosporangium album]MBB4942848.1 GNAT superfamily N-acetyltransferase [Streptosporangium album]
MSPITRLPADEFRENIKSLADLLVDVVAEGYSLGFLAPFDQDAAAAWWRDQQPAVDGGGLRVWAAHGPDGIIATACLVLEDRPAGRHRAEIVKIMVHPDARGRGLGRALLATAERAAAEAGITLLLLDTVSGTAAEHLYTSAGWKRYGVVPGYAADPHGTLQESGFFYKQLT